jgi:aspartate/methionine/tyrosine aminotransferase
VHEAHGAFYMTPVFKEDAFKTGQSLVISSEAAQIIAPALVNAKPDRHFAYQLLAATGICVVPLSSGFNSDRRGFRFTLLESDDTQFEQTIRMIAKTLRSYLDSQG